MGIDPGVNKKVSCGKKWEKMFHALHKVDMRACYAKQKINLACPNACFLFMFAILPFLYQLYFYLGKQKFLKNLNFLFRT